MPSNGGVVHENGDLLDEWAQKQGPVRGMPDLMYRIRP